MDKIIGKIQVKGNFNAPEFEVFTNVINMLIDKINELNDEVLDVKVEINELNDAVSDLKVELFDIKNN